MVTSFLLCTKVLYTEMLQDSTQLQGSSRVSRYLKSKCMNYNTYGIFQLNWLRVSVVDRKISNGDVIVALWLVCILQSDPRGSTIGLLHDLSVDAFFIALENGFVAYVL